VATDVRSVARRVVIGIRVDQQQNTVYIGKSSSNSNNLTLGRMFAVRVCTKEQPCVPHDCSSRSLSFSARSRHRQLLAPGTTAPDTRMAGPLDLT
jgi:hypothetical protein